MESIEFQGLKVPVDPDILFGGILRRVRTGRYERHEINAGLSLVKPDDRVLDIGAGIGLTGSVMSRVGGAAAVMSVEANPKLVPQIEELHHANGIDNVEVVNAALGHEASGSVSFYLREMFWSSSLDGERDFVEKVQIPRRDFNKLVRDFAPTLIMCDIEGGELDLFDERAELDTVRAIVLELHPDRTPKAGIHKLFTALLDKGFCYSCDLSFKNVVAFDRV